MTPLHAPQIFVDALNVAFWCGSPPSLRLPLSLLSGLLQQGHPAVLYFDANARYVLGDEAAIYEQLLAYPQYFVQVPSGKRADQLMLKHATAAGGRIISRDKYRDYRKRYRRLIDDPARLLAGDVKEDRVRVSGLGIDAPLMVSAPEAWVHFQRTAAGNSDLPVRVE